MHPDSRRKLQPQYPECYHLIMSTEEHIAQLTAQITTLQAQLTCCSQSPPPPQPSAAPPPPPKPPKVSAPSPFSGAQDDLDCFKAKCSLYLSMRQSKFPDEHSNVLFILLYMKGGSAGPWATQKINSILYPTNPEEVTWAGFISELDKMFVDPNHQATTQRKLATLHQGDSSVEELIQEFKIHGPISRLGDVLSIVSSKRSTPASKRASTSSSPCQPLGQSGSAGPPCSTTSGGSSETPS